MDHQCPEAQRVPRLALRDVCRVRSHAVLPLPFFLLLLPLSDPLSHGLPSDSVPSFLLSGRVPGPLLFGREPGLLLLPLSFLLHARRTRGPGLGDL